MTEHSGDDKTMDHVILTAGTQVSQYKIIEKIGAGGMGEVYLAEDAKLDRRVALKFMPTQYVANADMVSRFKREAQAAAKLDHPNIVTIYEVGEYQGRPFFAMQYVEGQSFVQLAHETNLPLHKIIELSIQILEGLQRAHQAGIIHRDIKSANILVDSEQRPKILDFGLATVEGGERLTKVGSTLGTVAYMSPEQAHGQPVDQRSDLFSFGVVLYELITAHMPFKRDSDAATLKAITADTPEPLARFRTKVPEELQRIMNKLLERDTSMRYQTASGVIADLKKLAISVSSGSVTPVQKKSNRTLIVTIVAAAIVVVLVGVWALNRSINTKPAVQQQLKLTNVTNNGKVYSSAISPDGRYLAYAENKAGQQSLWVRQVATSSNVQILPATDLQPGGLIFTPDGNYICYTATDKSGGRSLYQLPTLGGTPKLLVMDCQSRVGWSPDGKRLAFTRTYSSSGDFALMVADADGKNERRLIGGKGEIWYQGSPAWSPDGKLIAVDKGMWKPTIHHEIVVIRVEDGAEIWSTAGDFLITGDMTWEKDGCGLIFTAIERNRSASWQIMHVSYPGGDLAHLTRDLASYSSLSTTADNVLISVIYDDSRFGLWVSQSADLGVDAKQITSGIADGTNGIDWLPDGKIIYTSQTAEGLDLWSIKDDGSGVQRLVAGAPTAFQPEITGDGRYIVFSSFAAGVPNIWRADLDGQNLKQLTFGGEDYRPSSTLDGKWIVYSTWLNGPHQLAKISIDGGQVEIISQKTSGGVVVSNDGNWIAHFSPEQGERAKLVVRPFDKDELVKSFVLPPTSSGSISWSPDNKNIFYVDTRNDISNIWTLDISTGLMKQVTKFKTEQITSFAWSPDMKKLAISRGTSRSDAVLLSGYK